MAIVGVAAIALLSAGCDTGRDAEDAARSPRTTLPTKATSTTAPTTTSTAARTPCDDPTDPEAPGPAQTEVSVYFHCGNGMAGDPLVRLTRLVTKTPRVLEAAIEQLLAGPSEEEQARGVASPFGPPSADLLQRVVVRDGRAVVDFSAAFDERIPSMGTTNGTSVIVMELDTTIFQFANVRQIEYRIEGDRQRWCDLSDFECELSTRES